MSKPGDKDIISERVIQYVDDPKNSSALAKIHEMSNKAKRSGKSPTQVHRNRIMNVEEDEPVDKNKNNNNFNRRSLHFATVKQKNINLFNKNRLSDKVVSQNDKKPSGNIRASGKKEYAWDKKNNRLVEKPILEDKENEEKQEIIDKLKEYKKNREAEKKKDDKLTFGDDESDDEDIKKELKKLNIDTADFKKGNVTVKVITEEYDEKGNKIYRKEVTTNKVIKK